MFKQNKNNNKNNFNSKLKLPCINKNVLAGGEDGGADQEDQRGAGGRDETAGRRESGQDGEQQAEGKAGAAGELEEIVPWCGEFRCGEFYCLRQELLENLRRLFPGVVSFVVGNFIV